MKKNIPTLNYKSAKSNIKLLEKWLRSIYYYGFAKMTGGKSESGAIKEVANLIGYIRETNYGKLFDVKSKVDAIKKLKALNGKKHILYSAVCISLGGKIIWRFNDQATLVMRKLNNQEIIKSL